MLAVESGEFLKPIKYIVNLRLFSEKNLQFTTNSARIYKFMKLKFDENFITIGVTMYVVEIENRLKIIKNFEKLLLL